MIERSPSRWRCEPLAVEQGRLEERQVAVPVNDTALGDDPPGSHRATKTPSMSKIAA
jgi:hypothetical protein